MASWSSFDRVTTFSLRYAITSICHSFSTWANRSALGEMVVKRHWWVLSPWLISCVGPCRVQPSRVRTAAGPPGGPRWTGSIGVTRCGQSEPISSTGCTLSICCKGNPTKCLYIFWRDATWWVCSARPSLSAVKARWMGNFLCRLVTGDTVNETAAPWRTCWSCLTVRSIRSSGCPFKSNCCAAVWSSMVLSDPSSNTAYASIDLSPLVMMTLLTFRRTLRMYTGRSTYRMSLVLFTRQEFSLVSVSVSLATVRSFTSCRIRRCFLWHVLQGDFRLRVYVK